jgi:hypothetical protein
MTRPFAQLGHRHGEVRDPEADPLGPNSIMRSNVPRVRCSDKPGQRHMTQGACRFRSRRDILCAREQPRSTWSPQWTNLESPRPAFTQVTGHFCCAPEGTRTPNLLIRSPKGRNAGLCHPNAARSGRRCQKVAHSSGTPLCQAVSVLGWWSAGPGCGCSEVLTSGFGSAALDCRVAPACPPGPVSSRWISRSMCR